jgi:ribose 5-phosphate isomerase B
MRISVCADELTGIAGTLVGELQRRGHETLAHGVLAPGERGDWAWASEAVARDVTEARENVAHLSEIERSQCPKSGH